VDIDQIRSVLEYDSTSGEMRWKVNKGPARAGNRAGSVAKDGYRHAYVFGKTFQEHRLAWFMFYGVWPEQYIDHIDGNPSNNAISNLRDVSATINQQNQRRPNKKNKSSGYLGATFSDGKFSARIRVDGKPRYLGRFATAEEAHSAYLQAKRKLHEGCTI
jgi:hypothetical protein